MSDARHAAGIAGTYYDHYLIFGAGCGSYAYLGRGAFVGNASVTAHELGHVLGLFHAKASTCPVAGLNDLSCPDRNGNGSRYDFMGGTRELNAPHKDSLGWLHMNGKDQIVEVTQPGTYEIAPLNVAPKPGETVPRALKIVTGPTSVLANQQLKYVYVEFRQTKPGVGHPGVLLTHAAPTVFGYHGQVSAGWTYFLTPGGKFHYRPGMSVSFPRGNDTVTITVKSVSSDRAVVQVTQKTGIESS
jgi:hypothetical protein